MKEDRSTIYLDYASTTPVDPRVAEKMMQYLTFDGEFGNPASRSHRFGWKADEAVEEAVAIGVSQATAEAAIRAIMDVLAAGGTEEEAMKACAAAAGRSCE